MANPELYTEVGEVEITGTWNRGYGTVLTSDALAFIAALEREFGGERRSLLEKRAERQCEIDDGCMPCFLSETSAIRAGDWRVASIPPDLQDRRVEITGPVDRKMIINALNSGANVYMADFEDSTSPTWSNIVEGQINLKDAVNRSISYSARDGKEYHVGDRRATLMVRPRGWHLEEKHVLMDGQPVSASLFDFGLFFFHNAHALLDMGSAPYFYLPKLENHHEARLWNDVFLMAQDFAGIPRGTIRATVLIETILAAFEMDEILYELKDHSAGLNCGRWDYIFSFIKKFRKHPDCILPDRSQLAMTQHFLRSYSLLLIKTCHKRGAHAIGGMAAEIPLRGSGESEIISAISRVREDKQREVSDGHDGTWVAHPGLVPVAKKIFDAFMPALNQIDNLRSDVSVTEKDLLAVPRGLITEEGVRTNINVSVRYLESWLRGTGCVPIANRMEDAATAEISRSQLWQWLHHPGVFLADDREVTRGLVEEIFTSELRRLGARPGQYERAAALIRELVLADEFAEFLTLKAYDTLN